LSLDGGAVTDSAGSTPIDEAAVTRAIVETLGGVDVVTTDGNSFFFYDPGGDTPPDRRFPFATLVTTDEYDRFSDLSRPGVYRLNVGVSRETFRSLAPDPPPGAGERTYDFTALDRIVPHPVYGSMHWLCVLNPSPETFAKVLLLLAEAHERAARRYAGQRSVS
jgi:hypothetical protein